MSGPKRKRRPRAAEDVAPDVNQGGGGGPGQDSDQGGPGAAAPTPQNTHTVPVFPDVEQSETGKPQRKRARKKTVQVLCPETNQSLILHRAELEETEEIRQSGGVRIDDQQIG